MFLGDAAASLESPAPMALHTNRHSVQRRN